MYPNISISTCGGGNVNTQQLFGTLGLVLTLAMPVTSAIDDPDFVAGNHDDDYVVHQLNTVDLAGIIHRNLEEIRHISDPIERISKAMKLLAMIVEEPALDRRGRLSLYALVEGAIYTAMGDYQELAQQARTTETRMPRCTPAETEGGLSMDVVGTVNATGSQFEELLSGLNSIKEAIKNGAFDDKDDNDWLSREYVPTIIIPTVVSVVLVGAALVGVFVSGRPT